MTVLGTLKRLLEREPEFDGKVRYFEQQFDHDCGQTCLKMLGYDGHAMYPDEALPLDFLRDMPGVHEIDARRDIQTHSNNIWDMSFPEPIVLSLRTLVNADHLVVGYKRFIYCPSLGVHHTLVYPRKADDSLWAPNYAFLVPPAWENGQKLTSE